MQVNRRGFIGGTAAALSSATLLAAFSGKAFAQDSDTIKIAFAARGLRTIDPHKSIQGVDNWAIIAIHDKLVDLPRWAFPATLDELVPRWIAAEWPLERPRYVGRDLTWAEWLALPELPR